jgi:hypothetical protein
MAAVRRTAVAPEPIAPVAALPSQVTQSYWVMRVIYTIAPLIAGADKFFNLLTDWKQYLAPVFPQLLRVSPETFMRGVGVIEMVAGVLVAIWPRYFGYLVMAWLWAIIVDLLVLGKFYDVALRDLGLSVGAFSLARIAQAVWEARRGR